MKHLFLIFIALFLMLSCDRSSQDNEFHAVLLPETQTGANTFGCMVNGTLFYPRDGTSSVGSDPKGVEFTAL